MKLLAPLLCLLFCLGCQTNSFKEINEANAADDFRDGPYRIFKFGWAAEYQTEKEKRITEEYGVIFQPVAGDVIPRDLDLEKVEYYNSEMIRLLNEKYDIDLHSAMNPTEQNQSVFTTP